MTEKRWEDEILEAFPLLYHRPIYFEGIPDSWEPIMWDLSRGLEAQIKQYLLDNPEASYDNYDDSIPEAVQVKSKFGTLRFYMSFQTEKMDELIRQAEHRVYLLLEETRGKGLIY
jgi:hypothetical protein